MASANSTNAFQFSIFTLVLLAEVSIKYTPFSLAISSSFSYATSLLFSQSHLLPIWTITCSIIIVVQNS